MKPETLWFAVRADGNVQMGYGHIMRCLALAEWALEQNIRCVIITRSDLSLLNSILAQLSVEVIQLETVDDEDKAGQFDKYPHSPWLECSEDHDAEESYCCLQQVIRLRGKNPSLIVVDHYALAAPWEKILAKIAPVLVVDDLSDRPHCCDFLLDQTLGKTMADYQALINNDCQLLLGPQYALLRKEFYEGARNLNRRGIDKGKQAKLLINFGASDPHNVLAKILILLDSAKEIVHWAVTVVAGINNPNLSSLKALVSKLSFKVSLLTRCNDMAGLISSHDLCIGASGSSAWERCALKMPSIVLVLAENQKRIAENINSAGIGINIGCPDDLNLSKLIEPLQKIYNEDQFYMKLVKNASNICDGQGARYVLNRVLSD